MEKKPGYYQKLKDIENELVVMGDLVEKALARSIEALKQRDLTMAHKIVADDVNINRKRFNIENECTALIAGQQLAENDSRVIIGALNLVTELERIGDYADGIAKIAIMIGDEPPLKALIDIPRMADIAIEMIHKGTRAFVNRDVETAKQVISIDSNVDGLYDQVFRELLTFMMVDPKTINRATHLIWVAHNIERAADRATNICERVIFLVTGKMDETGASKY